jgi:hypothetical protein
MMLYALYSLLTFPYDTVRHQLRMAPLRWAYAKQLVRKYRHKLSQQWQFVSALFGALWKVGVGPRLWILGTFEAHRAIRRVQRCRDRQYNAFWAMIGPLSPQLSDEELQQGITHYIDTHPCEKGD